MFMYEWVSVVINLFIAGGAIGAFWFSKKTFDTVHKNNSRILQMQAHNKLSEKHKQLGLHTKVNEFDSLNLKNYFGKYSEYNRKCREGTENDLKDQGS